MFRVISRNRRKIQHCGKTWRLLISEKGKDEKVFFTPLGFRVLQGPGIRKTDTIE